jgi:hypothetical protein
MGIIRNSINIEGITSAENLPRVIHGQLIEFSETEYFYLTENQYGIRNISKIEVKINAKPGREVEAPTGKIVILDGVKRIEILYTTQDYFQSYSKAVFEIPFNTFIDMPNDADALKSVNIYVVDAYFKLMSSRKVYAHLMYMIDVKYDTKKAGAGYNKIDTKYSSEIPQISTFDKTITVRTLNTDDYNEETVFYREDY